MDGDAGFPDFTILISKAKAFDGVACMICIELKRSVKGDSHNHDENQHAWLEALNEVENIGAIMCWGAIDAMSTVSQYLKNPRHLDIQ